MFFIIPKGDNLTENQGGGVPGFDSILYNTGKTWYPQNYFYKPILTDPFAYFVAQI